MSARRFSVLILGHGEMGRSMEYLLSGRHALAVWERNLDDWSENVPLEEVAAEKDFVLFTLPANPHEELAGRIRGRVPAHCICLSIAKGLDEKGRTPAAILSQALGPGGRFGMLYGPMIAEELRAGRPGFAELGTAAPDVFERSRELFADTALHIRHTTDVAGISWAVIMKNVYVPLLGAAEELGLGDNTRGFLVAAALEEIARIVEYQGGRRATAYGLAGLADLLTTATSAGSHHRRVGHDLVRGVFSEIAASGVNIRGEGLHTVAMVERFGLLDLESFRLLRLVRDIVNDPKDIEGKFQRYLRASFDRAPLEPRG